MLRHDETTNASGRSGFMNCGGRKDKKGNRCDVRGIARVDFVGGFYMSKQIQRCL